MMKEIRAANLASILAIGICNTLLGFKKDHIKPCKDLYDEESAKLKEYLAGSAQQVESLKLDLEIMTLPPLEIAALKKAVFEDLSINGKALSALTKLDEVIYLIGDYMRVREQLSERYKVMEEDEVQRLYFGMPDARGNEDTTYPSCVEGIYVQTDYGLCFTKILVDDIQDHAEKIHRDYEKEFGSKAPIVNQSSDWSKPMKSGLFPDPQVLLAKWLQGFQEISKK